MCKIDKIGTYSRLPVTRNLPNSNLPLTGSNLGFLSDHRFGTILPSITRTIHKCAVTSREKKQWTAVQNIELISKQLCALSLLFCQQSNSVTMFNPVLINQALFQNVNLYFVLPLKWYLHSSPSAFLIFGYLLQAPNKWNVFRFPYKVQVIRSRLYLNSLESVVKRHVGFSLVDSL